MSTYTVQGPQCGTPKIIKPLKTTHSKHVMMGKLVDNGTCMYHKRTLSLKILGVKVVCGPIIRVANVKNQPPNFKQLIPCA